MSEKKEARAYVQRIGDGQFGKPEVLIRFRGTIEEQRASCRRFADLYAADLQGQDVLELFAAAPELLARLKDIQHHRGENGTGSGGEGSTCDCHTISDCEATVDKLIADAIAKAEGRS